MKNITFKNPVKINSFFLKHVIICFFVFLSLSNFNINSFQGPQNNKPDNDYFENLKKRTLLENDEKLIIIFHDLGSCTKCFLARMSKIKCALKEIKKKDMSGNIRLKYLALVYCSREIELNIFKDNYDWRGYMGVDRGEARFKLGLKTNVKIAVFNSKGNCLGHFDDEEYNNPKDCQELKEVLLIE